MASSVTTGLPYEKRNFRFTFKLNGTLSNPTDVELRIARKDELGKRMGVLQATKTDLHFVSTGIYTYSFKPDNWGWHYLRIWNENDESTKDEEYAFYVPQPVADETLEYQVA